MSQEYTPEETHNSGEGIDDKLNQLILAHIAVQSGFHAGHNSVGDVDEAGNKIKAFIHQELQKAREETEKAYGGCHYCYGKGYGTQTASWVGRGYYKKLPTMKFCTCERGKQLEQLLHSELDQLNK